MKTEEQFAKEAAEMTGFPTQSQDHQVTLRSFYRGKQAPKGFIYLIVRVKRGKLKLDCHKPIHQGLEQETINEIASEMRKYIFKTHRV